jgi:hypothetical protein
VAFLTVGLVTGLAFVSMATVLMSDLEPMRHWRQAFGVMRSVVLLSDQ